MGVSPSVFRKVLLTACLHHALRYRALRKKRHYIHQLTTMLSTSKNVLFPGHNHLLNTGTDDPFTLIITLAGAQAIIKVPGHQHQLLAGGYDLEIGHKVDSMVVSWCIVGFFPRTFDMPKRCVVIWIYTLTINRFSNLLFW